MRELKRRTGTLLATVCALSSSAIAADLPVATQVYFGDTHLHTNVSLDGYGDGNTKLGPDEAYSEGCLLEAGQGDL